ncbi:hypothetical protein OG689_34850 [Kitasatospora sp. NBC_00240]|uniref:hypothetical protein n=1 Tax=Kitasatospora sp. NBC_00240 TaxID=2903567 RepID=UPI00225B5591|nr:hypothetical protein [Kitasatospora sp. NBC_00240]MCX5214382.1 hypothetical protein [Kitasatospora sp. NBC_00240]
MKDFDLEGELTAAMLDRAEQFPPRTYEVDTLVAAVRRRRRRLAAGAAAALAVVVMSAGLVPQLGHDRGSPTVRVPAAPTSPQASSPSGTPSPRPPAASAPAADPSATTRALYLAALRYQDPATRGGVDLDTVAALFVDADTYRRIWGTDARGVTCGITVDGVLAAGEVRLYQGARPLGKVASLEFDGAGAVRSVSCRADTTSGRGDDPSVNGFYGGLVTATRSGDASARPQLAERFLSAALRTRGGATAGTCFTDAPGFWFADDPSSATLRHGWSVTLSDGRRFPIDVDEQGKIDTACE